ncbi:sensor histidine kinase [Lentisphaerota bacterium ZTH]|nr:sensor histidine kinase [Lentisphaerota bacterium]WET06618.1 sensor histidine kinase [Lentisphaerota bacterium ZTH]
MVLNIILIVLATGLAVMVILQRTKIIVTARVSKSLRKGISKERNATADILRLSREVIASKEKEKEFLPYFIKYTIRSMKASGGSLLLCGDDNYFYGCAVSGTFPPLKEVTPQIEAQLLAHEKRHTEFIRGFKTRFNADQLKKACGDNGFVFFENEAPVWFPERFVREAARTLIAPIMLSDQVYGCIIVTSKDDFDVHRLCSNDGLYLIRLAEIASLCLEVIKDFRKRQEYEQQLQSAREEGMMQVSSGIIHNIGNAVTIAKLTVNGLLQKLNIKKEERPETLIVEEIIPRMRQELKAGTLEKFLKEDPAGKQYLNICEELLKVMGSNTEDSSKMLNSLSDKLFHISEIIELQQRFVGELGTENMTVISSIIESSVIIFDESFNKRGYKIKTDLDHNVNEVLVDPSMLTQVFINIIKNAAEAMSAENSKDKKYQLEISLKTEKKGSKSFAVTEIKDNGPGMPEDIKNKVFRFGFSTKTEKNTSSRGIGLHFCSECVRKYGGMLECDSEPDKGTTFRVSIPIKEKI